MDLPPTSIEDIYPEGDVTLFVGEEKRRFTVSSMVLRNASPVFNKMFGPDFSEGQTLSKTGHVQVPLPEDNPEALLPILCVLHCQNDRVPQTIATRELYAVALLSDKYDLTVALTFAAQQWLDQPSVTEPEELWLLVKSATLFKNPNGFQQATTALIMRHQASYAFLADDERSGHYSDVFLKTCRKLHILCLRLIPSIGLG